jgi:hypothetical protein
MYGGNYKEGTVVHGIKWPLGMAELRIEIRNFSDYDYDGFDLTVQGNRDTSIAEVAPVSESPTVTIIKGDPRLSGPHVQGKRKDGTTQDIPVTVGAQNYGFRVRCDHLPKGSHVELLVATVATVPGGSNKVKVLDTRAEYSVHGRPFTSDSFIHVPQ